jgi:hypothetical protein
LEIYDKKHILSAHEFGERLAEHVNAKRKADLSTKPPPGKASVNDKIKAAVTIKERSANKSLTAVIRNRSAKHPRMEEMTLYFRSLSVYSCTNTLASKPFWRMIVQSGPLPASHRSFAKTG